MDILVFLMAMIIITSHNCHGRKQTFKIPVKFSDQPNLQYHNLTFDVNSLKQFGIKPENMKTALAKANNNATVRNSYRYLLIVRCILYLYL